jgi:hypothetical protein
VPDSGTLCDERWKVYSIGHARVGLYSTGARGMRHSSNGLEESLEATLADGIESGGEYEIKPW